MQDVYRLQGVKINDKHRGHRSPDAALEAQAAAAAAANRTPSNQAYLPVPKATLRSPAWRAPVKPGAMQTRMAKARRPSPNGARSAVQPVSAAGYRHQVNELLVVRVRCSADAARQSVVKGFSAHQ